VIDPSFVEVDGCRLAYSRRGEGAPVVFIQGVGVQGDAWRPQVDALSARYSCLWFDNRGVGQSQPAAPQLVVDRMARDTAAILDAEHCAAAHVVGHSLGGLVALRLALSARQRVLSLSLLCTFARGRDAGASWRMAWIGLRTRVGTRRMRRAAFLEILAAPGALHGTDRDRMAAELAPVFGHDLGDHPAIEGQQLSALRAEDVTGELAGLSVPTLVVSGAHDPISPPALGRSLAAAIPGAHFELLPDQAHGAPLLAAAATNALLLAHLDHVETRREIRPGAVLANERSIT
jgi:pimeloyl-ACP methyl ester carboxylesterase